MKRTGYLFCMLLGFIAGQKTVQAQTILIRMERQLCSIQDTLEGYQHDVDYEDYCDSLQTVFREIMREMCRIDIGMCYPFAALQDREAVLAHSTDGRLRVISRNTWQGGSQPWVESYVQYKDGDTLRYAVVNDEDDMGLWYDTVYTVTTPGKVYYLLSGSSCLTFMYPVTGLQAVSWAGGKPMPEPVFIVDDKPTDYLFFSYRYMEDEEENNGNGCRMIYDGERQLIRKPVVKRDAGGIEYLSNETEVYKLVRHGNGIWFLTGK